MKNIQLTTQGPSEIPARRNEAAEALVETYGVKVDPELHREVLDRYRKLNLAP